MAPVLDDFVAELFGIVPEVDRLVAAHTETEPLFRVKRKFVQRRAMLKIKADEAAKLDGPALEAELAARLGGRFEELAFARAVLEWQADEAAHAAGARARGALLRLGRAHRRGSPPQPGRRALQAAAEGRAARPRARATPTRRPATRCTRCTTSAAARASRSPTRARASSAALGEANYCISCHEQGKDSCSKGLKEKPDESGKVAFKKSPFGVPLAGCPLEERISEFHKLKTEGVAIGALAMITVDNPIVCSTGHRICNDCMKSCIYQRQDPVNIPQAETRTLKDVLGLPWGFEIYSLLTRWNPLNLRRPLPAARPPASACSWWAWVPRDSRPRTTS